MRDSEFEIAFKRAVNHLQKQASRLNCEAINDAIDGVVVAYYKQYLRGKPVGERYTEDDFYHIDDWRALSDDLVEYDGGDDA